LERQDRPFEQSRRFPLQDLHDGIIPHRTQPPPSAPGDRLSFRADQANLLPDPGDQPAPAGHRAAWPYSRCHQAAGEVRRYDVVDPAETRRASDHLPLVADLTLPG
jgi:hypothetical protein